jgi:hypothetical protein
VGHEGAEALLAVAERPLCPRAVHLGPGAGGDLLDQLDLLVRPVSRLLRKHVEDPADDAVPDLGHARGGAHSKRLVGGARFRRIPRRLSLDVADDHLAGLGQGLRYRRAEIRQAAADRALDRAAIGPVGLGQEPLGVLGGSRESDPLDVQESAEHASSGDQDLFRIGQRSQGV